MRMNYSDDKFPFRTVLSLEPLVEYWRRFAESRPGIQADLVRQVLEKVESVPELLQPIEDLTLVDTYRELVDMLMFAVLPAGVSDSTYAAAVIPFQPESFYFTSGFKNLDLLHHLVTHFSAQGDFMTRGKALKAYSMIFDTFYGENVKAKVPMFLPVNNPDEGLTRYFKIDFDISFTEIVANGPIPELSAEDINRLLEERMNLELWKKMLPPEIFEFRGFGILTAVEVTEGQLISAIQKDLLDKDTLSTPGKINTLQSRIRSLMRLPSLEMGLISVERGEFDSISSIQPLGKSLLLSRGVPPNCPLWSKSLYSDVSQEIAEPLVISDLDRYPERTGFEEYLLDQGYRSLLLAPLVSEGRLVGILELGSRNPHDVNASLLLNLKEVTSLLAVAVHREISEKEDRIQAIIKQQYTSIHPTVEWRFRDAAKHYIEQQQIGEAARAESIVFQHVYPLYGLSDIRGSSEERNASIQADLAKQLALAREVLVEANHYKPLFALEEIIFRLNTCIEDVQRDLRSGDEITILQFLKEDVAGQFKQLAEFGPRVVEAIAKYEQAIDPEGNMLYERRKEYEDSVRMINDTIGAYIETQEVEAQRMYPHFFEMFKTDGVDYNLYVGQSLVENKPYSDLYLHNLRLWQLKMMCGVHAEMRKLLPKLPVPLHVAQLILVQSIPIAIRFRIDEKKFDVDGAYNIRYEIVKKRIDKALIEGTGERLTQPGKIAIVYSQEEEAQEYRRYIHFLKSNGYLEDTVEDLTLKNMQGVHGLRALRVTVNEARAELESSAGATVLLQNGDGKVEETDIVVEVKRG